MANSNPSRPPVIPPMMTTTRMVNGLRVVDLLWIHGVKTYSSNILTPWKTTVGQIITASQSNPEALPPAVMSRYLTRTAAIQPTEDRYGTILIRPVAVPRKNQ